MASFDISNREAEIEQATSSTWQQLNGQNKLDYLLETIGEETEIEAASMFELDSIQSTGRESNGGSAVPPGDIFRQNTKIR